MKRLLRSGLIGIVSIFLVFGLVAGLWLPGYLKTKAQDLLTGQLGRPVTIGEISISPYTLSATVQDFRVGEAGGQGSDLAIASVYVNLSSASLFALAPVVQEIRVLQPQISLRRFQDGRLSIADVIERLSAAASQPGRPEGGKPFEFAIHNITVSEGLIELDDQLKKQRHVVAGLEIGIPFVSSFPSDEDVWVEPRLSATIDGAPFALKGQASIFGDVKRVTFQVDLDDLSLAGIESYAEVAPGLKIRKAALSSALEISFTQQPQQTPEIIVAGRAAIRGIDAGFQAPQSPWQVSAQSLNLEIEALDLRFPGFVEKSRVGKIKLFTTASQEGAGMAPEAAGIRVRDSGISRVDPFVVSQPAIAIENVVLSGESAATLQVDAIVNRKGRIQVSGQISGWQNVSDTLRADLKLNAKEVEIVAFQRFASEQLGNTLLTKGAISLNASLGLQGTKATLTGEAQALNFNLLEPGANEEILGWRRVQAKGIALVSDPFALRIKALTVDRPVTRLVLQESGRLNFAALVAKEKNHPAPEPKAGKPAAKPVVSSKPATKQAPKDLPVVIDSLVLRDADLFFTDRFTKPNFQASLTEISGTVAPLKAGSPGTIDIRGRINKSAPLAIAGVVDPFSSSLFLDMRVSVQGADLPPVSPYSIRHLAYPIERGKLSLDLSYKIKDRALDSQNRIRLDQLTLGPKTESPDALSIPLGLAVALLKNSKGEIEINLPVGGSLDDPQFSVAGLVFRALVNLLVKAITSPFALLGSLFGDGADLSKVDFMPGSSQLTEQAQATLERLAKALGDRPALRLDITATVNPAQEKDAMQRAKLMQQVKAKRLAELAKAGKTAGSLEEVTLSNAEYQRILTELYKEAPFKKPRNLIGMVKSQPVEEMQARLLEQITLTESDSLALANQRSQAVREWLVGRGVSASQLFLVAPGADASKAPDAPGQVLFSMSQ